MSTTGYSGLERAEDCNKGLGLGPFEPVGLDLRLVLFIFGFPAMLFFAFGRGIAVVRAIIEAKEGDKGSLSLGFCEEVRLYNLAPNPTLIAYRKRYTLQCPVHGVKTGKVLWVLLPLFGMKIALLSLGSSCILSLLGALALFLITWH